MLIKPVNETRQKDFINLYIDAFSGPPWFEVFDSTETFREFNEMLRDWPDAILLGAYDGDRCIGGAIGFALHRKSDILEVAGDVWHDAFYIAELFVDTNARECGICQELNRELIRLASSRGFNRILVRTALEQTVIQHIFLNKLGFDRVGEMDRAITKCVSGQIIEDAVDRCVLMGGVIG